MIKEPLPVWLWMDASRSCNLACKFCYSKASHKNQHMAPEDFRNYLDKLMGSDQITIQKMNLNWRGGPADEPPTSDDFAGARVP